MHFEVVPTSSRHSQDPPTHFPPKLPRTVFNRLLADIEGDLPVNLPAQWVNCDVRSFDYSVLGQWVFRLWSRIQILMYTPGSKSLWLIHLG